MVFVIGVLSMSGIGAQNSADALRYAQDEIQGTARFRAMGGAFGALGGDMSAVNINPAGSAIFNSSHVSLSLGYFDNNNDVNYFNGSSSSSETSVDLNQAGGVFVYESNNANSPWRKFVIGAAYDRVANFDDDWFVNGTNPTNTIGNYFLEYAQGNRLDEISALPGETISQAYSDIGIIYGFGNQQAFLGFESFIIDPADNTNDNTVYSSNIAGTNFDQGFALASRGYNGKLAFNFATQYKDNLFIGINLNSHFLNYERSTYLRERNTSETSAITRVDFQNNLLTTGSGFSFQIGTIAKIAKALRVGLSYTSPTWYYMNDETSQFVATADANGDNLPAVDPRIINIFPEYRLRTPGKFTGSLAYVFGNKGLISFDYSVKDYSNMRYSPTSDPFFAFQNTVISNTFTTASTYRIGGEYRHKQFSFRGGYRFEESPYKNADFYGDLTGYSFGLGYNFGDIKIDASFAQSERETNYQLFDVGLTDAATLDTRFTDVILTLSFNI